MKIGQAFPSKYLGAADIGDEDMELTITEVVTESVGRGDDQEDKPVVYFKGTKKGFVLNKTNAAAITMVCGSDDTDDWEGKKITLYATETEFAGKTVDCIRVRTKKPKQQRHVQDEQEEE